MFLIPQSGVNNYFMIKILLTHSYFLRLDPKQWTLGRPYAPLGTLHAASMLASHGYEPSFFDTMFAGAPSEIIPVLDDQQPDILVIYDDGFNYLTKMCLENMRDAAFRMISLAKTRGIKVLVCSSDSTDRFDLYLDAGADMILMGEGEQTLCELADALERDVKDFSFIPGIAFREGGKTIRTRPRELIRNLDDLPLPAWDLIDMEPYREMWMKSTGYFSMNMCTTRGCPFKCNWCAKPIYGSRYHSRSPAHVVREIAFLKDKYRIDHIWFCDDIFGLKPGWIREFAQLVRERKLNFRFKIQARADLLLRENDMAELRSAGCENIWMGAESGSQRILDAMDKGITVEQIYQATRMAKENGILPSLFIQFGYLDETREDIDKTIVMINELLPHEIGISVSYPLPGTVFYEKVKSRMSEKTNWTDSDELALMFHNTYEPAFYRQLHRFVHKNYRKQIAFDQMKKLFREPFAINTKRVRSALAAFYFFPASWLERVRLKKLEKTVIHG